MPVGGGGGVDPHSNPINTLGGQKSVDEMTPREKDVALKQYAGVMSAISHGDPKELKDMLVKNLGEKKGTEVFENFNKLVADFAKKSGELGPGGVQREPILGPGGEQKLLGPGGTQKLLGPGGVQPLLGPGGVQQLLGPGGTQKLLKQSGFDERQLNALGNIIGPDSLVKLAQAYQSSSQATQEGTKTGTRDTQVKMLGAVLGSRKAAETAFSQMVQFLGGADRSAGIKTDLSGSETGTENE
ncbi:MAG: hypothetical protein ACKVOH_06240 [Chlamydiales bacterium]